MNAPINARPQKLFDETDVDSIRHSIEIVRTAVARLLFAASMQREGALSPNWDTDMQNPAIAISNAVSLLESTLNLERDFWRVWTTDEAAELEPEGSAES